MNGLPLPQLDQRRPPGPSDGTNHRKPPRPRKSLGNMARSRHKRPRVLSRRCPIFANVREPGAELKELFRDSDEFLKILLSRRLIDGPCIDPEFGNGYRRSRARVRFRSPASHEKPVSAQRGNASLFTTDPHGYLSKEGSTIQYSSDAEDEIFLRFGQVIAVACLLAGTNYLHDEPGHLPASRIGQRSTENHGQTRVALRIQLGDDQLDATCVRGPEDLARILVAVGQEGHVKVIQNLTVPIIGDFDDFNYAPGQLVTIAFDNFATQIVFQAHPATVIGPSDAFSCRGHRMGPVWRLEFRESFSISTSYGLCEEINPSRNAVHCLPDFQFFCHSRSTSRHFGQ